MRDCGGAGHIGADTGVYLFVWVVLVVWVVLICYGVFLRVCCCVALLVLPVCKCLLIR